MSKPLRTLVHKLVSNGTERDLPSARLSHTGPRHQLKRASRRPKWCLLPNFSLNSTRLRVDVPWVNTAPQRVH